MQRSREDTFCEDLALTNGTSETTVETVSTNVLDFGSHGDDLLAKLRLFVHVSRAQVSQSAKPSTVSIYWETSAAEAMGSDTETLITPVALGDAALTLGAFPVANLPMPTGLKRYNRLRFLLTPYDSGGTEAYPTTTAKFTAFLTDGREDPV